MGRVAARPRVMPHRHRMPADGVAHRGLEAHPLQLAAQPFRRLAAVSGMGRLGADAGNAQQVEKARPGIIEMGIDVVEQFFGVGH
jgi:hypothetical protein